MKRYTFSLLILVTAVLIMGSWSWASCPEAPIDNGNCDTLRVSTPDAIQTGTVPWYVRVPLWITHDVPNPIVDSIAAIVIPLCYTSTNPSKYCSVTAYYNKISWTPSNLPRSIFRHLVVGSDTTHNWMMDLYDAGEDAYWHSIILDLDGTSHFWLSLIPTGTSDQRFGPGNHVLIAMMTFKIQDTMHVSIDTCLWTPSQPVAFSRSDGHTYVPRDNMPITFWIGTPRLQVTSPNGGEHWAQGTSHDITWLSENFDGGTVKIEYSTNNGGAWTTIIASTANNGSFTWNPVPNTPSPNCLVRVSNTAGGTPVDQSDAVFAITSPDFNIAATPDTQTVIAGNSTSYIVNLDSLNGFNNAVTCSMRVIGSSTGITWNFTPNPVTPPGSSTMNVHTTTSTAAATYKLEVIGTYASLIHKDTVTLIVTPVPDFTLSAKPDTQQVIVGNGANYNVILLAQNGFSQACSLKVTGLPTGATANFDINPVTPSDTAIMNVSTTTGSTPQGTYKLTITATELTKAQKSTDVYLVVKVPDFTILATPDSLVVRQGEQGNYTVSLTSLYGFSSPCTLTVEGLPTNVTGVFTPPNVTPTGSSTLTITADLAAIINKYPLIITGKQISAKGGAVLAHSDTVLLDLRSTKDFDLTAFPETLHVAIGETSSCKVKLTAISGFNAPCSLLVSSFPSEISGGFVSSVLTPTDSTSLHITASCNALVTTTPYPLTITAKEIAGSAQHNKQVWFLVDPTTKDYTLESKPDTQEVMAGDSTIYNVLIHRHACFTRACTLSIENGLPPGAAYYFKPNIIPDNDSISELVVSSGSSTAGVYKLIIRSKATVRIVKDTVTIVVKDFSVSSSQDTAIVTKGQSVGIGITVNSLFGFAEQCTLMTSISVSTKSVPPNPPNCVLDKVTLIPTDNAFLNVYTATETDTGWYDITITARRMTGKATVLEHSHHIALKVEGGLDVNDGQDNPNAPKTFALFQNQPNPFNPTTEISYYLPKASQVKLTVYNVLGQSVRVLYDGYQEAGTQNVTWDGKSADGNELSSGIYFYRLQAGAFIQTKKMSLMK